MFIKGDLPKHDVSITAAAKNAGCFVAVCLVLSDSQTPRQHLAKQMRERAKQNDVTLFYRSAQRS